ncbi:hypothetical protein RND81_05G137700 [Saponaria officinalis]|uniref:Isopenicillin N synthase-like Fe(2+) 2OG dioxygenase domain-containing protein n=1 Tax=Saponaria officinalis TaxID=3572 RepID=A0AAW1KXD2_SAPOF
MINRLSVPFLEALEQIVTNGKLKSVKHRVITNATLARMTVAFFIEPRKDCLVLPAKSLIGPDNPPLYRPVGFREMLSGIQTAFMGEMDDCSMETFMKSLKVTPT